MAAMRTSVRRLLRILGSLLVVAGVLLWASMLFHALSDLDRVTPGSEVGGLLVARALGGTLAMIAGLALLQAEGHGADGGVHGDRPPRP